MEAVIRGVSVLVARDAPDPAGIAGLAIALVTVAVLTGHQLAPGWDEHAPPGPVRREPPPEAQESVALRRTVAVLLVLVLAVVILERFVVLT